MDMHQKHVNKMFRFEVSHIEIVLYRLALRCHGYTLHLGILRISELGETSAHAAFFTKSFMKSTAVSGKDS